jgi:hypothetical protein
VREKMDLRPSTPTGKVRGQFRRSNSRIGLHQLAHRSSLLPGWLAV